MKINGIRPNHDGAILTGGMRVCGPPQAAEMTRFAPDAGVIRAPSGQVLSSGSITLARSSIEMPPFCILPLMNRVGVPLTLIVGAVVLLLAPIVYGF